MTHQYENQHGNEEMMGFVLGIVVGAVAALLLAPASGNETRRKIAETTRRWRDKGQEMAERVRDRFEHEAHGTPPQTTGVGQGPIGGV